MYRLMKMLRFFDLRMKSLEKNISWGYVFLHVCFSCKVKFVVGGCKYLFSVVLLCVHIHAKILFIILCRGVFIIIHIANCLNMVYKKNKELES